MKRIQNEATETNKLLITFKIFFFSLSCVGRLKFLSWLLAVLQLTSHSEALHIISVFSSQMDFKAKGTVIIICRAQRISLK